MSEIGGEGWGCSLRQMSQFGGVCVCGGGGVVQLETNESIRRCVCGGGGGGAA